MFGFVFSSAMYVRETCLCVCTSVCETVVHEVEERIQRKIDSGDAHDVQTSWRIDAKTFVSSGSQSYATRHCQANVIPESCSSAHRGYDHGATGERNDCRARQVSRFSVTSQQHAQGASLSWCYVRSHCVCIRGQPCVDPQQHIWTFLVCLETA